MPQLNLLAKRHQKDHHVIAVHHHVVAVAVSKNFPHQ